MVPTDDVEKRDKEFYKSACVRSFCSKKKQKNFK